MLKKKTSPQAIINKGRRHYEDARRCVCVKLMSRGGWSTQERLGGTVSEKQTIDVIYPTLIFYNPRRSRGRNWKWREVEEAEAGRATETHKGKESFREGPASVAPQRRSREKERR